MSLTGIELDMFLCPELKIAAPADIFVYADEESNLVFNYWSGLPFDNHEPSQRSCDSLSTVSISLRESLTESSFRTWHILMNGFSEDNEWIYVGEIRFLGADADPNATITCIATEIPLMVESTSGKHSHFLSVPNYLWL